MKCAAGISARTDAEDAVHHVIEQLHPTASAFDAMLVFFTGHHAGAADKLSQTLLDEFGVTSLIGCSCEGVIGPGREIENGPGLSVMALSLGPGVRASAAHVAGAQWKDATQDAEAFKDYFGTAENTRGVLAMGDPWTTPVTPLLAAFDAHAAGIPLVGGMASGAQRAGQNVLLFNDARFDEGLVALSLSGGVTVEPVVSQGSRPIGRPLVITKCRDNVIEQLGGRPAVTALNDTLNALPEHDRALLDNGLLIGRAISEYKEIFVRGDFIVRSIVGVSNEHGVIGIGDRVRVGQTVQFHVRDAGTAHEDLNLLLATRKIKQPAAAVCFSCNGRGSKLFSKPNHDALAAANLMPATPLAGFFAAGELGPVAGKNFIHGHTASLALIE